MAINGYAGRNAAKRKAREAMDRAREPVITYYVVPRELVETSRTWLDLVSSADDDGCRIHRVQKRKATEITLIGDEALVYEGAPGQVFVARQNW